MAEKISSLACRIIHLGLGKRMLVAAFATSAVAGPLAFGVMQNAPSTGQVLHTSGALPSFEVASIRQDHSGSGPTMIGSTGIGAPKDRFMARNMPVKKLICWAYGGNSLPLPSDEVSGGPAWINSDRWDIDAKLEDSQIAKLDKLSPLENTLQVRLMVQSLLARRFGLVVKDTTVIRPVYVLNLAKSGPKIREASARDKSSIRTPAGNFDWMAEPGEVRAHAVPITFLVRWLSQIELGRPVLDRTGLTKNYSFDLKWTPDANSQAAPSDASLGTEATTSGEGPSIFTAIQEQLGLKLEPAKGPVETIEIVHINKPSEN